MLHWRNHPEVRAVSADARAIDPAEHDRWVAQSLASPQRLLWIAQVGPRPLGVLRFDLGAGGAAARVSIFLDPALTGLGLGARLLARGEAALRAAWPAVRHVEAEVLADNAASQQLFRRAGYQGDGGLLTKPLPATP